jgi:hypothetical protein
MKGRWFDGHLRVRGWDSEYASAQKLLDHLSRRTKSESSRVQYLQTLATLCRRENKTPDQLVRLYGSPADGFSWSHIASYAQSNDPQKVGRLCMRVLDRTKKVLELIYTTTCNRCGYDSYPPPFSFWVIFDVFHLRHGAAPRCSAE